MICDFHAVIGVYNGSEKIEEYFDYEEGLDDHLKDAHAI
jgi:hypothetical protein